MLSFHALSRTERWLPAAAAALCWALAAGGALLWWLHAPPSQSAPAAAVAERAPSHTPVQASAVLRALGHTATAPEAAGDAQGRFVLLGVVAGASGQGAALLAVDGQPARAYSTGQTPTGDWLVHNVGPRGVTLQSKGQKLELVLTGPGQD